jgi:xylulokinase
MNDLTLGRDVGTSAVKAVVADEDGNVRGQASSPLPISRPQPNWSEQDPESWCDATRAAVLALDAAQRSAVRAIGLSGQMHGATLLGRDHRPLRPAIRWNDGRSGTKAVDPDAALSESRASKAVKYRALYRAVRPSFRGNQK